MQLPLDLVHVLQVLPALPLVALVHVPQALALLVPLRLRVQPLRPVPHVLPVAWA